MASLIDADSQGVAERPQHFFIDFLGESERFDSSFSSNQSNRADIMKKYMVYMELPKILIGDYRKSSCVSGNVIRFHFLLKIPIDEANTVLRLQPIKAYKAPVVNFAVIHRPFIEDGEARGPIPKSPGVRSPLIRYNADEDAPEDLRTDEIADEFRSDKTPDQPRRASQPLEQPPQQPLRASQLPQSGQPRRASQQLEESPQQPLRASQLLQSDQPRRASQQLDEPPQQPVRASQLPQSGQPRRASQLLDEPPQQPLRASQLPQSDQPRRASQQLEESPQQPLRASQPLQSDQPRRASQTLEQPPQHPRRASQTQYSEYEVPRRTSLQLEQQPQQPPRASQPQYSEYEVPRRASLQLEQQPQQPPRASQPQYSEYEVPRRASLQLEQQPQQPPRASQPQYSEYEVPRRASQQLEHQPLGASQKPYTELPRRASQQHEQQPEQPHRTSQPPQSEQSQRTQAARQPQIESDEERQFEVETPWRPPPDPPVSPSPVLSDENLTPLTDTSAAQPPKQRRPKKYFVYCEIPKILIGDYRNSSVTCSEIIHAHFLMKVARDEEFNQPRLQPIRRYHRPKVNFAVIHRSLLVDDEAIGPIPRSPLVKSPMIKEDADSLEGDPDATNHPKGDILHATMGFFYGRLPRSKYELISQWSLVPNESGALYPELVLSKANA